MVGGQEDVSEGVIEAGMHDLGQHVLVVDDSGVARKQMARVLSQIGVEYTLCNDGRQALEQLQQWLAEGRDLRQWLALVISDVEMPKMDGYSLTKAIRGNPELKGLFVLLHTSLSGVFNKHMVQSVGADDFLPKWEPDTLAMRVQEQLKRHAAHAAAA